MEKRAKFIHKLSSCIFSAGLALITTQSAAANTLDAMNSLTPASPSQASSPARPIIIPASPTLDAKAYVLMDANSGNIIASQNAEAHLAPASLTKMMTVYVAFNALKNGQIKLDDKVTVSQKAWQTGGSRMFLNVGQQVTVEDLLHGIIVDSGNDAAVALAEYIGGNEETFTSIMNQEAQRIGMTNSNFTDANGLPHPQHYSSAKDLAILAEHIINDFPEYYPFFEKKEFTFNNIKQSNRNRMLWRFQGSDGLKTGHTDEAGYCLVTSATQGGMRLISVVLGAPSDSARTKDSVALMTYGFRFYKTYKLYTAGETITEARVWKGEDRKVPAGVMQSLYVTIPVGRYEKLAASANLSDPINAPVAKGQNLGMINITLEGKPYMNEPLVALKDDPKGGLWTQLADTVSRSIHDMFNKKKDKAPAANETQTAESQAPTKS